MLLIGKKKVLVFDTETTGLPNSFSSSSLLDHEILQLAMIDGTGTLLVNEFFKPAKKKVWPEAQKIHGISPKDVCNKPAIREFSKIIQDFVDSAELLVAYNIQFDLLFLRSVGIKFLGKKYYDVMRGFSQSQGNRGRNKSMRRVPLKKCAAYYGYELADAHDAEADARATLHCFLKLQGEH